MAEITKAVRQAYGLAPDLIPAAILKSIDQAELLDRLVHVADLTRRANRTTDPVTAKGYRSIAKAVLTAQPRLATEQRYTEIITKAAGVPNTRQADALKAQAQELLAANPVAPRREEAAIAKAKANDMEGLVVVYDATGRAIGICQADKIQPVADPADLAKVQKAGKARRPDQAPRRTPGQGWPPRSR